MSSTSGSLAPSGGGKSFLQFSARIYMETDNRWIRSSSAFYGPNIENWTDAGGTGADPTTGSYDIGWFLPAGTKVTKVMHTGRGSAADISDIELLTRMRYPTPPNTWETSNLFASSMNNDVVHRDFWWNPAEAGQPPFAGAMGSLHSRTFEVDHTVPEGGAYLDLFFRPVGTLAARRYLYWNTAIEVA